MQLSQEGVLLLGAVISLAISLLIIVVVHDRDLRKIEKSHQENKREEILYELEGGVYSRKLRKNEKATKNSLKDGLPELVAEFSEPNGLELWVEAIRFGLLVGFAIFSIFIFFSCSVHTN